jgi:hypothetical protein
MTNLWLWHNMTTEHRMGLVTCKGVQDQMDSKICGNCSDCEDRPGKSIGQEIKE